MRWNSIQTPTASSSEDEPPALPLDDSRLAVVDRAARLTLEQRISLFEALSRDAAWARTAVRVR